MIAMTKHMVATVGTGLAVLVGSAPALAADVTLTPSSQWVLDYAEDSCRLARTFGEGADEVFLYIEQVAPGAGVGLTMAGRPLHRFRRAAAVTVQFGPVHPAHEVLSYPGELEPYGPARIVPIVVPGARSDAASAGESGAHQSSSDGVRIGLDPTAGTDATYIELRRGPGTALRLETGSLEPVYAAMNRCTDSLLRVWGLDVDAHQALRAPVEWTNTESVIDGLSRRYPLRARRFSAEAVFRFRLMIDAEGQVTDCIAYRATLSPDFQADACDYIAREARFTPAVASDGRPIDSFYAATISYRIAN